MKPLILTLMAAVAAGSGLGQPTTPPDKPDKPPLLADGDLPQMRPHLVKMFPFTLEGPNLKIDRTTWGTAPADDPRLARFGQAHPIEGPFKQIQTAAGAGGGGMSISNQERRITFSGGKLGGLLHTRGDNVRLVTLEEVGQPQRTLEFSEDGQGGFHVQIKHPDGDLLLLHQSRKGAFRAVAFLGRQTFAGQGESFAAFFREHRAVMDADILPVLEQFGIQLILSSRSLAVRRAVLAQLLRTPEALQEGKKLLADLDSEQFDDRKKATQLLNDRFEMYQDLIRERLEDKSISLEVRTRLKNLVAEHADAQRASQTVALLELTKDPAYLVSLLDQAAAPEAAKVIGVLEKITGQKLGADPAAWKEWASKNLKGPPR
jgi:hypothetical protein